MNYSKVAQVRQPKIFVSQMHYSSIFKITKGKRVLEIIPIAMLILTIVWDLKDYELIILAKYYIVIILNSLRAGCYCLVAKSYPTLMDCVAL